MRKEELDYFAERIGLRCLDGEQHGRRMEMGFHGHIVEREMHCWVEVGRGEVNSLMHKKLNQAVQKAAQSIVLSKSARLNEERISNMRF